MPFFHTFKANFNQILIIGNLCIYVLKKMRSEQVTQIPDRLTDSI